MTAALRLLLLLFVPAAVGVLVVRHALGSMPRPDRLLLALPLGLCLGLGMTGCTTFLSLVLFGRILVPLELALAAGVLWAGHWRRDYPVFERRRTPWRPASRLLLVAVLAVLALALISFCVELWQQPDGGWDAWDFWNMRARFFARGGAHWRDTFSQIPWWTHPEYPVLLPAMGARGYRLLDQELPLVGRAIAATFTLATVALLFSGLRASRTQTQGLMAAMVLAATPYFVFHGSEQYADVPVGFLFLATLVLVALYDQAPGERRGALVLAGVAAGLATFLKNEGQMFFVCFAVGRSIVALRAGGRRRWRAEASAFALGAAPFLALLVLFKLGYSVMPDNAEFYSGPWKDWNRAFFQQVYHQLSDGSRYTAFFAMWWRNLVNFDEWRYPLLAVLAAYAAIMGLCPARPAVTVRTVWLALLFQVLGISAVFLLWSTYDLYIHMDALNRLLLQMLPSILFGVFLAVREPWPEAKTA